MGINLEGFVKKKTELNVSGKSLTFSEITLADFAQFRSWVIDQKEKSKGKRRDRMMAEAERIGGIEPLQLLERLEKPLSDEEVEDEMATVEGCGQLAYLSLKHNYPEITIDNVMNLISVSDIPTIITAVFPAVVDDNTAGNKKKQTVKGK